MTCMDSELYGTHGNLALIHRVMEFFADPPLADADPRPRPITASPGLWCAVQPGTDVCY